MGLFRIFQNKQQAEEEAVRQPSLPQAQVVTESKVCPYCQKDLSSRKMPTRRSQFKCPGCSKKIYVEPKQPIYPTPYLDDVQVRYVNFLSQLDLWVFGIGSNDDYRRKKAELAIHFGKEPGVGDVIWGLMNDSLIKACKHQFERRDMKNLMEEFKEFEKELK